ncbi:MAG: hypothetical protein LQ340_003812, partial [Diploschistes diacapsis]
MISLKELQASVSNWHGLDPSKFGALKLSGRFATSRDARSWQNNADCFLFEKVMVITVEKEPAKRALRGSVLLKDLKDVKSLGDPAEALEMQLASSDLPVLKLRCNDQSQLNVWKGELS